MMEQVSPSIDIVIKSLLAEHRIIAESHQASLERYRVSDEHFRRQMREMSEVLSGFGTPDAEQGRFLIRQFFDDLSGRTEAERQVHCMMGNDGEAV